MGGEQAVEWEVETRKTFIKTLLKVMCQGGTHRMIYTTLLSQRDVQLTVVVISGPYHSIRPLPFTPLSQGWQNAIQ